MDPEGWEGREEIHTDQYLKSYENWRLRVVGKRFTLLKLQNKTIYTSSVHIYYIQNYLRNYIHIYNCLLKIFIICCLGGRLAPAALYFLE